MANKKHGKFLALSLLALLGLTACSSDVVAEPSDYNNKILETSNDIYNNTKDVIYDAIRSGSLASDVLDKVLYEYSISTLGRYDNIIPKLSSSSNEEGVNITLKAATKSAKSEDKTLARAFIKAHKAYWSVNDKGEHVDDDNNPVSGASYKDSKELARVVEKWNTIEARIAEAMYDAINTDAYKFRNKFEERKFVVGLRNNLKAVNYKDAVCYEPQILNPDYDKDEVFDYFLHRGNYQTNYELDKAGTEKETDAATYIEDEIIPTIYRRLLTEQYLLDETYNTLGRSYARQVNIITIASNNEYPKAAEYLMREFIGPKVISAAPAGASVKESTNKVTEESFELISNIWKGVGLDAAEAGSLKANIRDSLLASKAIVEDTAEDGSKFYKGTEYGDMMEEYSKIKRDPLLTDSAIESTYTGNGSYTVNVGKTIKTDEISLKSHITKGWFVKNGDLSTASDITSRLFSVGVASGLDTGDENDRWYKDGETWKYDSARDANKYVARINGSYFLKVASTEAHDTTDPVASANDILFESGGTYYVVQILEAANAAKLSKTNENNYAHIHNDSVMEEYVNEITKVLGGNSTYETLAKKHWVSKMDIEYHDTVVYEYFETNFPELFED